MQQPGFYNAAWNPYDTFTDYNGSLASTPSINMNLNPAALLAQSAHGASNGGTPQENTETPATIDPTLMMTINPSSYSQYVSPTQTQYLPSGSYAPSSHGAAGAASYQPYMPHSAGGSSLTQVLDYTPELGDSSIPLPPPSPLPQSTEPLIDQVKKLLTAKQLDQVPQETAHKLIDLLLPGKSSSDNKSAPVPVAVDKDTRLEIFTRIRDNAPKQFFAVLANDLDVLTLLREWGKNAAKKEEFEETLMGWLQVIERLPLSLVSLSQSGLGRIIKYVVDHPPTNGESSSSLFYPHPLHCSFFSNFLLFIFEYFSFSSRARLSLSQISAGKEVSEIPKAKLAYDSTSYVIEMLESSGKVTSYSTLLNSKHVYPKHHREIETEGSSLQKRKAKRNKKSFVFDAMHNHSGERRKLPIEPRLALFPKREFSPNPVASCLGTL
ncbi:hypothetical protein CPB86DRAFT_314201 [Serendipita vermifera]|nr:hypothetical protein CPB86DRAFT_314201 [Serendipita vermifera]